MELAFIINFTQIHLSFSTGRLDQSRDRADLYKGKTRHHMLDRLNRQCCSGPRELCWDSYYSLFLSYLNQMWRRYLFYDDHLYAFSSCSCM